MIVACVRDRRAPQESLVITFVLLHHFLSSTAKQILKRTDLKTILIIPEQRFSL